jgi:hypothetical protein
MSKDGQNAYVASYRSVTNNAPAGHSGIYYWPGCPDGQTGDGGNWPCMNDPIQAGNTNSGGGLGMSQWGSWEWAEGLSFHGTNVLAPGWQCILDHYYNDNGNATGAGGSLTYRYSFLYGPGGDGSIAFPAASTFNGGLTLYSLSTDGSNVQPLIQGLGIPGVGGPSWSPDHTALAYANGPSLNGEGWNVYTINTKTLVVTPITSGGLNYSAPVGQGAEIIYLL